MRWGLVPFWAKDIKVGFANINAKAEGIENKPAFREAFRQRRCLVPVDNFYEWKKPRLWDRGDPRRGLQPYGRRQRARTDDLFQRYRQRPGCCPIRTASTLTTPARGTRSI
jgi:putative SOS response-associated peptidase YedK